MPGKGDPASGNVTITVGEMDLPSLLMRLEANDVGVTREAVATVREAVTDEPTACVPTVPKLRALLERDALDFRDAVAYCLAELAAVSPEDVAPSTETIAGFARTAPTSTGQGEALRCLAHVAASRPDAVRPHLETVADVLAEDYEADDGVLRWGVSCLSELTPARAVDLEGVRPALEAALEDDRARVRRDACLVVGHERLTSVVGRLEEVAAEESNPEVRKWAAWALEHARDGD